MSHRRLTIHAPYRLLLPVVGVMIRGGFRAVGNLQLRIADIRNGGRACNRIDRTSSDVPRNRLIR